MKYKTCTEYWLNTKNYTFRGEFEKMYQDIEDPWGCHKESPSLINRLFMEILFSDRSCGRILDIGCGLGGLTNYLRKRNGGGEIIGCDISKTAIEKARSLYPDINFKCLDVLVDKIEDLGRFNLVIMAEILWYILDGVKDVFSRIYNALTGHGICGIHQYFPFEQKFGRDVIDGLEGFEKFICRHTLFSIDKKVIYHVDEGVVLLAVLEKGD